MNGPVKQKSPRPISKPISLGLTCWFWQIRRARRIKELGARLGVSLLLTEHIHGLRRDIRCQVSGKNVDKFIGEFARHS